MAENQDYYGDGDEARRRDEEEQRKQDLLGLLLDREQTPEQPQEAAGVQGFDDGYNQEPPDGGGNPRPDPPPDPPREDEDETPPRPAPPTAPTTNAVDPNAEWNRVTTSYDQQGVPLGETDLANFRGKNREDIRAYADALIATGQRRARPTFSNGGVGGDLDLDQNAQLDAGWQKIGTEGGGRFTKDSSFAEAYASASPEMRDALIDALQAGKPWQSVMGTGGPVGSGGPTPSMTSWLGGGTGIAGNATAGGGGMANIPGIPPELAASFNQQNALMAQALEASKQREAMAQQQYAEMVAAAKARDEQLVAEKAAQKTQRDQLFGQLRGRAHQAASVDPNDPIIKGQTDAYRAEQERSRRNLVSDAAEGGRPLSDIQRAMSEERVGQATGSLQAELMARELSSRRSEIADALSMMGGLLDADQRNSLSLELGNIDNLIKQQQLGAGNRDLDLRRELGLGDLGLGFGNMGLGYNQLGVQRELGLGGLSNELMRAMLQNQQFYSDLGLRTRTQDDTYDLYRRGRMGNTI